MNEKTPNKKISRDKILNILNKIQKSRNQINFDSENARMTLAEIIASELDWVNQTKLCQVFYYEQKNAK
jgi:hypothetical protein